MQIVRMCATFMVSRARRLSPILREMTRAQAADGPSDDFTFRKLHQTSGTRHFGRHVDHA
jgi:hypothetical protein